MRYLHITKVILVVVATATLLSLTGTNTNIVFADPISGEEEFSSQLVFLPTIVSAQLSVVELPFGVAVNPITELGGLFEMRDAGNYFLRRGPFMWKDVEPNPPLDGLHSYEWESPAVIQLENEMRNAQLVGMNLVLIVGGAPDWAREDQDTNYSCAPIDQEDLDDFAMFLVELVKRYNTPSYNIEFLEIYNEPDIDPRAIPAYAPDDTGFGCWGDIDDPTEMYGGGYYAEMLSVIYPAISSLHLDIKVLVGGLLLDCDPINVCSGDKAEPPRFLEGILSNNGLDNGGQYIDGISFHGYDYFYYDGVGKYGNPNWDSQWNTSGPVTIAKTHYINDMLVKYGYSPSEKLLLNTESAIICSTENPCDEALYSDFELTKAFYLTQSYTVAQVEGLHANIWYYAKGWRNSGLLYPDLTHHNAYDAYVIARTMLANARFIDELYMYDQVAQYEFLRAGNRKLWVIWSRDGDSHSITLPSTPTNIIDALGNPVPISSNIIIDIKPIYIEWAS